MEFRKVTERDFRKDKFLDADPEDYEFRGDGEVVRKDRWETGIRKIASMVGIHSNLEIDNVVTEVEELLRAKEYGVKSAYRDRAHISDWA